MLKIRAISVALTAGLLTGCVGGAGGAAVGDGQQGSGEPQAGVPLAMPEIPAMVVDPGARADYATRHFWDALAEGQSVAREVMEQNVANFAAISAMAGGDARKQGFAEMWSRMGADTTLMEITEDYLYDPESPVYSPDLMMTSLEAADSLGMLDGGERERQRLLLADLRRNAPGSVAADFAYTDLRGRHHRLHERPVAQLLLFYDPDCEHCAEEMSLLAASEELARAVAAGRLAVRAIYPGADVERWRQHAAGLPEAWTVGMNASDPVGAQGVYDIRTTPSIYLLDDGGRVALRETRAVTALANISAWM